MDQEDYERQLALINNNVNVSKTSDGKEFLILVAGLIAVLVMLVSCADFFANLFITYLPTKSQIKIEKAFGKLPNDYCISKKYLPDLITLQYIRDQIAIQDKTLINKGDFPIVFVKNKNLNAWIVPNGTIYFTTALLDKHFSEEELAFVLAHEIGHYKHRDHLRSISRQIIINAVSMFFVVGDGSTLGSAIGDINTFANYSHSRNQERNADLYASDMLIKLYGTNDGGVQFFSYLKKVHNAPEFLHYFSTHPSPQQRLYLITGKF